MWSIVKMSYAKVAGKLIHSLGLDRRLRHWGDEEYLKLVYWIRMRRRLNLDNPRGFNEKLQWLKLHDRDPKYTRFVDKHLVKEHVATILGPHSIVPTLGVWNDAAQIKFDELPEQFVLKVNHNSGGVIICRSKEAFDTEHAVSWLNEKLKQSYYWSSREWPYRDVPPLVFAEEYLPETPGLLSSGLAGIGMRPGRSEDTPKSIVDYKFFCFHGTPRFLNIQQDMDHDRNARFAFLNLDWTPTNFGRAEYPAYTDLPSRPRRLAEMIKAAKLLSADIPFVRVDLFEHDDRVLFSEMTFYPTSGMIPFRPQSADRRLGSWLDLDQVAAP